MAVHAAIALALVIGGAFTSERSRAGRTGTNLKAITFSLQQAPVLLKRAEKDPAKAVQPVPAAFASTSATDAKQEVPTAAEKRGDVEETPVDLFSGLEFLSFRRRLIEHIRPFHHYPDALRSKSERGVVLVGFMMQRNGTVREIWVESSSGSSDLDLAALTTIRNAQPLPVIPNALPDTLTMTVPLSYTPARLSVLQ